MPSFRAQSRNLHLTLRVVALMIAAARGALAQVVSSPDSLVPFERPNGALLRPGSLTYQLSLRKPDGSSVPLGVRTVNVSEQMLGGVPSWSIVESRSGTVVPTLDS